MTKIVVVCLGVLVWCSVARASETFEAANRLGETDKRAFFFFSTSAGKYVIRHDGMGEVHTPAGRKRVFYLLNLAAKSRIERLYFLEHEGDLYLFYETHDASFLMRMDQQQKKPRWTTPVTSRGAPAIEGDLVIVGSAEISKADGRILRQD
jgi:hypothetical protein